MPKSRYWRVAQCYVDQSKSQVALKELRLGTPTWNAADAHSKNVVAFFKPSAVLTESAPAGSFIDLGADLNWTYYFPTGNLNTFPACSSGVGRRGGSGVVFDGNTDEVWVSKDRLRIKAGVPLTVEGWIYPTDLSSAQVSRYICRQGSFATPADYNIGYMLAVETPSRRLFVRVGQVGGALILYSTTLVNTNEWSHVAFTYDGTTVRLFLNGVLEASATLGTLIGGDNTLVIGRSRSDEDLRVFQGVIDEFRVTTGVARYTANFTPPGELPVPWEFAPLDGAATLTSSHLPASGALTALVDGSSATDCTFSASDMRRGDFFIEYDMGTEVFIDSLKTDRWEDSGLHCVSLAYKDAQGDWVCTDQQPTRATAPAIGYRYTQVQMPDPRKVVWSQTFEGGTAANNPGYFGAHGNSEGFTYTWTYGVVLGAWSSSGGQRWGTGAWNNTGNPNQNMRITAAGPEFGIQSSPFTVQCFFRPTQLASVRGNAIYLMRFGLTTTTYTTGGWVFAMRQSDNRLFVSVGTGSAESQIFSLEPMELNTVYHGAFTYDGTTLRLFVDGKLQGSVVTATADVGTNFWFGTDPASPTTRYFHGPIDEVSIHKECLWVDDFCPTISVAVGTRTGNLEYSGTYVQEPSPVDPVSWPTGYETSVETSSILAYSSEYGGKGKISGTVKIDSTVDIPVRRKVRLFRDRDGLMLEEQWSDATTGAYLFYGLNTTDTYTVISYDHTGAFRAVIADRVVPEV